MTSTTAVDNITEENEESPEMLEPWKMFTSDLVTKTEPEDTYSPESNVIEEDDSETLIPTEKPDEDFDLSLSSNSGSSVPNGMDWKMGTKKKGHLLQNHTSQTNGGPLRSAPSTSMEEELLALILGTAALEGVPTASGSAFEDSQAQGKAALSCQPSASRAAAKASTSAQVPLKRSSNRSNAFPPAKTQRLVKANVNSTAALDRIGAAIEVATAQFSHTAEERLQLEARRVAAFERLADAFGQGFPL